MTNTCDKFSGGGGDVAPSPRSPALSGDRKKTQRTVSVPIENCLIRGVHPKNLGPTWVHLLDDLIAANKEDQSWKHNHLLYGGSKSSCGVSPLCGTG